MTLLKKLYNYFKRYNPSVRVHFKDQIEQARRLPNCGKLKTRIISSQIFTLHGIKNLKLRIFTPFGLQSPVFEMTFQTPAWGK